MSSDDFNVADILYPLDDVESEYLIFELIDSAAETIDFHNASPFVKLSWILCVTRFSVVDDRIDDSSEDDS